MLTFTFTSFHLLYTFHLLSHSDPRGSAQALERQKEYTDAIRIERDDLREEVVKLKDILKVLSLCVNAYFSLLLVALGNKYEILKWENKVLNVVVYILGVFCCLKRSFL